MYIHNYMYEFNMCIAVPGHQAPPVQWMARPNPISGCPPGLEYLTQVDQLLVKQKVELLESKCVCVCLFVFLCV